MEEKKIYRINISMPNLINLCVDNFENEEISGRIYHRYQKEPVVFSNIIELLNITENLFDKISYPQASARTRKFVEPFSKKREAPPEKIVDAKELLAYRGERSTFALCVKFRQNVSWQGEIVNRKNDSCRYFSSTLEFIKILIEGA